MGTAESPYLISDGEQFAAVAKDVNNGINVDAYFKLTNDIYLGGWRWTPIGTATNMFCGNFEGDGHTIYGLKVRAKSADQGLFGRTGSGAVINGVTISGGSVITTVDGYCGSLVGNVFASATITNCHAVGVYVNGLNYVGGLLGYVADGTYSNITSSCDVYGQNYVGGLIGNFKKGTLDLAVFSSTVNGNDYVGGLIGQLDAGTIGPISISCVVQGHNRVGGVVGYNSSASLNSVTFKGRVDGNENVGGIVGYSNGGTLQSLHATGTIKASMYVGGLVGYHYGGTIKASVSETTLYATSYIGGIAGLSRGTITGTASSCHITGTERYGGLVGSLEGTLSHSAGFGSLYGGISYVGGIVGSASSRTITACSFVGDSDNKNVLPFVGIGTSTLKNCYSIINQRKYISTDLQDENWLTYYGIIDQLATLPMQRELSHVAAQSSCTLPEIQALLKDFDLVS